MLLRITALCVTVLALGARADVWTVDAAGGADYDLIQDAIYAAADGDMVQVAPGTYLEALNFCGRDVVVEGTGGAEVTIITPPAGHPGVSFLYGERPEAVLRGFTITGADTSESEEEDPRGAGIHINYSCPTLTDLVLEGNHAQFGGGLKMKWNSYPLLQRVIIRDNRAVGCAGGLYLCQSSPTLIDVEIRDNVAETQNGGGVIVGKGSYPRFHRVLIEGNAAAMDGGGVFSEGVENELEVYALFSNTTLANNICDLSGNGGHGANVYLYLSVHASFVNCIVADALNGEGIYVYDHDPLVPDSLAVSYSDFWGNSGGDIVAREHGELLGTIDGQGVLQLDPLFVEPEEDFHLQTVAAGFPADSPCIDVGYPGDAWNDPDGTAGDLGAYGGPAEVDHDISQCSSGASDDPCAAADDDDDSEPADDADDSAPVEYKDCVCRVGGAGLPTSVLLLALGGLVLVRRRFFALLLVLIVGCSQPLEEAPADIDDPLHHMFVHFHDADTAQLEQAFTTYVTFLEGCEDDGGADRPECDLDQGLVTSMLTDAEVQPFVDAGTLDELPTAEQWEQAVSLAVGRRMAIPVDVIEDVLIQPDQHIPFTQFEEYEREYLSSMEDYLAGSEEFLHTRNEVVSSYVITTAELLLMLDFRQIQWGDGEQAGRVVAILSWFAEDAFFASDGAAAGFTFSLEVLIPTRDDPDATWRTQAMWSHADLTEMEDDDHAFWEDTLRDGTIDGFDQLQYWVDHNY